MSVLGNIENLAEDNIRTLILPHGRLSPPVAVIMVGVPASGKTTLAKKLSQRLPLAIISDEYMARFLFTNKATLLSHSQKEFMELAAKTVEKLIQKGVSCIYDSSVKTRADRKVIKDLVEAAGGKYLLIYLNFDKEKAYERVSRSNFSISRGEKKGFILNRDLFEYEISQTETLGADEDHLNYQPDGEETFGILLEQIKQKLG